MVSANLVVLANGIMNGFLLGASRKYRELSPDNILLYKIAVWGFEHGYKWFHMGGGRNSKNDSLLEFKKGFYQGKLHRFYIGKYIFNEEVYQKLLNIRKEEDPMIEVTEYFPKYRGGGN